MEAFWKAAAAVLLAVILGLVLDRQEKDISVLLTIAVCVMVGAIGAAHLEPVLALLRELEEAGGLQEEFLGILLKAVGVGVTGELIACICADAGKASLGKALQLLSSAVILSMAVPVFYTLLAMVRQILGGL